MSPSQLAPPMSRPSDVELLACGSRTQLDTDKDIVNCQSQKRPPSEDNAEGNQMSQRRRRSSSCTYLCMECPTDRPQGKCVHKISLSAHGFRQLYPTLSNQLGMPVLEQEAIGHWKEGSAMPQHYDISTNSLEIRAKQQVLNAPNNGYDGEMPGDFLMDVPTKPASPSSSSSSCPSSLNTPLG